MSKFDAFLTVRRLFTFTFRLLPIQSLESELRVNQADPFLELLYLVLVLLRRQKPVSVVLRPQDVLLVLLHQVLHPMVFVFYCQVLGEVFRLDSVHFDGLVAAELLQLLEHLLPLVLQLIS